MQDQSTSSDNNFKRNGRQGSNWVFISQDSGLTLNHDPLSISNSGSIFSMPNFADFFEKHISSTAIHRKNTSVLVWQDRHVISPTKLLYLQVPAAASPYSSFPKGLSLFRCKISFSHAIIQYYYLDYLLYKSDLIQFNQSSVIITIQSRPQKSRIIIILLKINTQLLQFHHKIMNVVIFLWPEDQVIHIHNANNVLSNK